QISTSLGRNLGVCGAAPLCTATALVPLIAPFSVREPRQTQVDVRLARTFVWRGARVKPRFDAYNVFNANDVQSLNSTYGQLWRRPVSILPGRLFKFGTQLDF